jgi:Ca2+-binding EF-hand superfamily protein
MPSMEQRAGWEPERVHRLELFLRHDGDEDGRLSREELRQVLAEVFHGDMDEEWFSDIWSSRDGAQDSSFCDFAAFTKLFEGGPSPENEAAQPMPEPE